MGRIDVAPATRDRYEHPQVASMRGHRRRRRVRHTADLVTGLGPALVVANIVMQLADPRVGYGVLESRVDSGNAIKHPVKRARTTGTYLAVALLGSEHDRAYLHDELKRVHGQVFSTDDSPVRYSGNDSRLQLWVAVCLLKYFIDQYELLYGPLSQTERDRIVVDGRALATTLNVDEKQWPADHAALLRYWDARIDTMGIDPPVQKLLSDLADLSFLEYRMGIVGTVAHLTLGRPFAYLTRAALPAEFRSMMGWHWSSRDQWYYDQVLRLARIADPATGRVLRAALHTYVYDMRLRRKLGLAVF